MAKLDRLGAEAGIKQMTPEIYKFSQLLNDDKLKQWDEWRSQRTWVGLTSEEIWDEWIEQSIPERNTHNFVAAFARAIEAKLKELNT